LIEISNAKKCGYKIYLYVISTSHPDINEKRVQMREKMGGHSVPLEKIKKRYHRCLNNIYNAMLFADRAFFFDNSGKKHFLIAHKVAQKEYKGLFLVEKLLPSWFNKYVLDKILKNNKI
jgi:predicted ABC-type ATPase